MSIDEVLVRIRTHLRLEADTENEVIEEIRTHLEEAVQVARDRGMDEDAALAEVASRFGMDEVGQALQQAHVGRGTTDGVMAAALPVICALVLRWLVFAPDGTAVGWQQLLARPSFWGIALVTLLAPMLRFWRRRYALVAWGVFWALSVVLAVWPALRW